MKIKKFTYLSVAMVIALTFTGCDGNSSLGNILSKPDSTSQSNVASSVKSSLSSSVTTENSSIPVANTSTSTKTAESRQVVSSSSINVEPVSKPSAVTSVESEKPSGEKTVSQKNALKKAKSYIDFQAFSHDGLVEQLEFEGFSHEDAVYGADNCGADWNEQAVKKAKS